MTAHLVPDPPDTPLAPPAARTAPPSDGALIAAARGGDDQALDRLLRSYQARVFRFGLQMCGDTEDAKDVLQDTLFAAALNLDKFRGDASLSTWLFSVARSFCIKKRRRGKFEPASTAPLSDADALHDPAPLPDEAATRGEVTAALERALRALTPQHREVLLLRDVEGLSAPEVAKVLGLGERAVKSRLHRARAALRDAFLPVADPRPPGCPDVLRMFSRNLEGELTADVCTRMERHLAGCPHCRATCDALKKTLHLCASSPAPSVPPDIAARLRSEVRALSRAT